MVPFGGWEMPVQYEGILAEHKEVRAGCGVFDICHMGELFVRGAGVTDWLNRTLSNDVSKLVELGQGQYSLLLNDEGGVIDDLILYRMGEESFFIVINASRIEEDVARLRGLLPAGIELEDCSEGMAGMALQGPRAMEVLAAAMGQGQLVPDRFYAARWTWQGQELLVARTGYTGEDGVELFLPASHGPELWRTLLAAGAKPCGLGARDSLRLEAGYPLYGHELTEQTTPVEAGLLFAVGWEKTIFPGKERLVTQRKAGAAQKLVAILADQPGTPPPRDHYPLFLGEDRIGEVTSGGYGATIGKGIAMAYVATPHAKPGTVVEMEARGKRFSVTIARRPLYKNPNL